MAETPDRVDLLRDHLGADARHVELHHMVEIGANPARVLGVWQELLDAAVASGRGLRGIGEPAWPGRRAPEMVECHVHERLLNAAFEAGPGWWLLCPYDVSRAPAAAVREALRTHPSRLEAGGSRGNREYDRETVGRTLADPLPPVPERAVRHRYDADSLGIVRPVLREHAESNGLAREPRDALVLAGWEVAVNSVMHGRGEGALTPWREPGALVCQVDTWL